MKSPSPALFVLAVFSLVAVVPPQSSPRSQRSALSPVSPQPRLLRFILAACDGQEPWGGVDKGRVSSLASLDVI